MGLLLGACGSAGDDRPADWAYIAPAILIPNCATSSCHSESAAVSGMDMSTEEKAYISLTGLGIRTERCIEDEGDVDCTSSPGAGDPIKPRPLVTPGNPSQSRIVNMMRAIGAERMPPDRPLAEADIALIEEWISKGAKRSTGGN